MPAFPDDTSAEITAALGALPTGAPVSEVARRPLDLLTSGSIEPGTRLPPERQVAATLGVGRSAVREALAALELLPQRARRSALNETLVNLLHLARSLLQVYTHRAVHDEAEARVAFEDHAAVYRAL